MFPFSCFWWFTYRNPDSCPSHPSPVSPHLWLFKFHPCWTISEIQGQGTFPRTHQPLWKQTSLSQLNCCLKWWPFAFWHKSEKLKKNSLIAHLRQPVLSLLLSQLKPHLTIWEFSSQCSCLKYNRWPLISKLKSANKVKTIFLYWISLTSRLSTLKC